MSNPSTETYLIAAQELLLTVGQSTPNLTAEQYAYLQEAVEFVERTQQLHEQNNE